MTVDERETGTFGQLLRQHRLDAGLTQAALAERAGISLRAVQDLERSVGRPQRGTARRLAEALGLAADPRARFDRAAAPAPRTRQTPRVRDARGDRLGGRPPARSQPDGEQKRVTVLVAEVVGLADSVDAFEPDRADRLQAQIVPALTDAVHRRGGTVSRVDGDGIMAIFGAPVSKEDDAVRACLAALALHESFGRVAGQYGDAASSPLALRVGLASSEVVLRGGSGDRGRELAALGPAVRAAGRLAQAALDGSTLLAMGTARAAEGYVHVRPVESGSSALAGAPVFELLGSQPVQTRFRRLLSTRRLTRFVGRDAEAATLALLVGRARAGQGQVVGLVGEPGVGKSRLIWEATRSAQSDGWLVLECGALSHDLAASYEPAVELLKAWCQIEDRDEVFTAAAKLTERVLRLDRALAPDLPALLALLGLPIDDVIWDMLAPPQRRDRTLAALKRLLIRQSQEQPLILVVEDLHWIDPETQALLDTLVESVPAVPMLLLVSYRPEYTHPWARKTYYTQLPVETLATQPADDLLGALLGDDPALGPLRGQLIQKTEGNPLFLEESVRGLVDTGTLTDAGGAYRQTRPVDTIRLPDTVQTVLGARIDRLDPAAKRLLQIAAVIGKDVPLWLLRTVAELTDDDLHQTLAGLLAAELLYEAQVIPEAVFTFKHALTHDVAYGSLLHDRRRALHARIVTALEASADGDGLAVERLAEHVDRLAEHAWRGELWHQAVRYLRSAGQRDGARGANRQAAAYFTRALDALGHLPESRETRELAVDVRLDLRNVLLPLNEFATMFEQLQRAEALAIALDDRPRLAWVSAYLTAFYCNAVQPREAEAAGRRARRLADELDDLPLQVMSHFFLGLADVYACRYAESIERLSWNVERLRGALAFERFGEPGLPAVFSRSYLLRALAELGRFDEALARGEEAVTLAESSELPLSRASALEGLGFVHLRRGALPEAVSILERALELCEAHQLHIILYPVQAYLGYAYAQLGRDAEATALLTASAAVELGLHPSLRMTMLGEAHVLAGRHDEAARCAGRALVLADAGEERGNRAWALRLSAEIARQQGPHGATRAAELFREALALADGLEMHPLRALCQPGLVSLDRRA
ncbi:MAG: AAA family ATPase [Chloroflexota bacterium]